MTSEGNDWVTVKGNSGGKRNQKGKFQAAHGAASFGGAGWRQGPPISLASKLNDIAQESHWFRSAPQPLRQCVVNELATMVERQVQEMRETEFFRAMRAQLQSARQAMQATAARNEESSCAAAAATCDFDIVIYGIGRFAELSLWRSHANDAPSVTPSLVRSSLRQSSRAPMLQLAAILAMARELTRDTQTALSTASCTDAKPSSSSSAAPSPAPASDSSAAASPASAIAPPAARIFMYDPLLSALEQAVGEALGIEMISHNEEGKRSVSRPTLFYMPHCPQTLYNNVLDSNWGLSLTRVMILGNSLRNYAEAAAKLSSPSPNAHSSSSGYLRVSGRQRKKKDGFAAKLAANSDDGCCNHAHDSNAALESPASSVDSSSSSVVSAAAVALSPSPPSLPAYPYPCLALIEPLLRDSPVRNIHESQTVFNDLTLHYFALPDSLLQALRTQQQQQEQGGSVASVDLSALPAPLQPFLAPAPSPPPPSADSAGARDTEIIPAALSATASTASAAHP